MQSVMHVFTVFLAVVPNVSGILLCHTDGTIGSNWTVLFIYEYYLLWTVNLFSYLLSGLFSTT